jgi:uncharacterized HAD superfamily protein
LEKHVVSIDLDGTIADTNSYFADVVMEKRGRHVHKSDMVNYQLHTLFEDMSREEAERIFKGAWSGDNWRRVGLVEDTVPSVIADIRRKYIVYVCTASKGEGVVIERWLKEKGIGYDRFIIAEGHSGKLLNGADIYVDDYSDLAVEIAARGKRVVLLKQPWNSSFAEKNRDKLISVAENWDDVRRLLLRDAVQG